MNRKGILILFATIQYLLQVMLNNTNRKTGKYHYHRKKSGSSNTSSSKKLHLQEVCILATALKQ
jgi:hypothetical protein|nr:MAG TPA: hypothetical protein [Caudoviricetes sp.]